VPNESTGIVELIEHVKPGIASLEDIRNSVYEAMGRRFKQEFINRLGENIVIFDFISEPAMKEIVDTIIMKRINNNICKSKKIEVTTEPSVLEWIYSECWKDTPRKHGGRGIGNVIEEHYLNPLSKTIFDEDCKPGDKIKVEMEIGKIVPKVTRAAQEYDS
jgi:ATP-dependent Clp protease ATP-binding subunit ClpA